MELGTKDVALERRRSNWNPETMRSGKFSWGGGEWGEWRGVLTHVGVAVSKYLSDNRTAF